MKKQLIIFFLTASVSACSFTGYGGQSEFRCSNAFGQSNDPLCESISTNYDASVAGVLTDRGAVRSSTQPYSSAAARALMNTPALQSGTPIRSQTEIARIWIAPYLDSDGDLIDQSFTYVTLNEGRWLIEHNQQQIIDDYRPVRLLGGGANNPPEQNSRNTTPPDQVPDIGLNINLNNLGSQPTSAAP